MKQANSTKASKRLRPQLALQQYRARMLASVGVIAVAGAIYIISSSAATNSAVLEAESASLSGTAHHTDDTNASGAKAVMFGTAAGGNTGGTTTPPPGTGTGTGTTTPSSGYKDGTYTGDDISHRFGDVQVAVTISGGKITAVNFVQLNGTDGHSDGINSDVSPELVSLTLNAQDADFDGVSGATYTSDSYKQSLQSALDKAKA